MASKVYFTDFRSTPSNNLLRKLQTLVTKAGLETIDFERKIVAIKIHFGEPGNLAYLRPNYAATIVKLLKKNRLYLSLLIATHCIPAGDPMVPITWKQLSRMDITPWLQAVPL